MAASSAVPSKQASEPLTDTTKVPAKFDELIHEPTRMRICGLLAQTTALKFSTLRDTLGVSDAVCSKHVKALADRHYVSTSKVKSENSNHQVSWISLTKQGRRAFDGHMNMLRNIAEGK